MKDLSYFIFFWIFVLGGFIFGVNQVANYINIDTNYQIYHHEQKEKPVETYDSRATFTAYNSVPQQTDSSPCQGAGGNICEISKYQRVCATRLYKLGTIIDIEGLGPCVILDRTSIKYGNRIDIFMDKNVEAAKQFGIKELRYRIVEQYTSSK